jgi:hypothetical protein
MSTIDKQELFEHLSTFLKRKGVSLEEGTYTRRIQQGCGIIADTVNKSQSALATARTKLDRGLDQVRRVIHEKTAPKPSPVAPAAEPPKATSAKQAKAPRKRKGRQPPSRSTKRRG